MKCPSCGHDNLEGEDRCVECMEPLRDLDVPRPKGGFQAQILLDPIEKIYSTSPTPVSSNDPVLHAVAIMRQLRAGALVVMDQGKLTGIVSEVDFLFKAGMSDFSKATVSQFMTRDPVVLEQDASIASALHEMSVGGYRHLPVVRDGRVVGIVSSKDILGYLKQHLL